MLYLIFIATGTWWMDIDPWEKLPRVHLFLMLRLLLCSLPILGDVTVSWSPLLKSSVPNLADLNYTSVKRNIEKTQQSNYKSDMVFQKLPS